MQKQKEKMSEITCEFDVSGVKRGIDELQNQQRKC
jgi:hypothetical protein